VCVRERESAYVCVFVCVRVCMCVYVHTCLPGALPHTARTAAWSRPHLHPPFDGTNAWGGTAEQQAR
jgi:hypothetical protein